MLKIPYNLLFLQNIKSVRILRKLKSEKKVKEQFTQTNYLGKREDKNKSRQRSFDQRDDALKEGCDYYWMKLNAKLA